MMKHKKLFALSLLVSSFASAQTSSTIITPFVVPMRITVPSPAIPMQITVMEQNPFIEANEPVEDSTSITTVAPIETPRPKVVDSRIQYENYTPDKVFVVRSAYGKSALIQLEEGETLDGANNTVFGSGDQKAWSFAVRGNNITFKPLEKDPETNLILVTNKRTYAFDLKLAKDDEPLTYILRFNYLDTAFSKKDFLEKEINKTAVELKKLQNLPKMVMNTAYTIKGDFKKLFPNAVWDDGIFTYFQYASAVALPVVYKVNNLSGKESLVDSHIEGDTLIVHELSSAFILRLGDEVIEITNHKSNDGTFNETGTSVQGLTRQIVGQ
jgi:type IV secretion system protein VirB9